MRQAMKIASDCFRALATLFAMIRHLESIEGAQRSDIQWPEKQNHASPVEVVFKIGAKLYALEHTGIEPFEGHVGMTAQANRLFEPSERL